MMRTLLFYFTFIFIGSIHAQFNFRSPVDGEIKIAANFGELRANHFHSGIDIRTDGEEGWKVYAVEDGFVSRILTSKKGYGNALYITHPNGLTSVYAHLSAYNDIIKNFASACQTAHEDFELDTILLPTAIPVKKGDVVAFSGNTGGSSGPHLHFEIRDTKTEFVINPENVGFEIKDIYTPRIFSVAIFSLQGYQSKYVQTIPIPNGKTIPVTPGRVGIGMSGIDYYSDYQFNAGLYNTQLFKNDTLIFEKRMDTFSFDHWRCINAHLDYEVLQTKSINIEKCFHDDGDLTEIYPRLLNQGIINIKPGQTIQIRLVTKDHAGNQMQVAFALRGTVAVKKALPKYNALPLQINNLTARKATLTIPAGAIYDTCMFSFYADTTYRKYSYKYVVGARTIPLQKEIELKILPITIPKSGTEKLYVKSLTMGSVGGKFTDGYMVARTKTCGVFVIDVDTNAPIITPINIPYSKNISANTTLKFRIYDTQTGVKSFKATANGKYILFSYDLKYNLITCNLNDVDLSGNNDFELTVTDGCGNIKRYKTVLTKN